MTTASKTLPEYQQTKGFRLNFRHILTVIGAIFLIFFALVQIMPFVFTVANSFKCLPSINSNPLALIPAPPIGISCTNELGGQRPATETSTAATFNPSLDGFLKSSDPRIPRWLFNSIFLSVSATVLHLLLDSMAGYALARLKFPGNRLFFFVILGTMMIPGIVLIIPRFIIMRSLGMLDTYQGLILPAATSAFGIFLMKQFFESIPNEIEEAAQVDGASRYVMFFRIILPMATPALTALAIFSFQGMWNAFLDPLIVAQRNPDLWNLPLGLALLRGNFGSALPWDAFLAGSVVTTLPLALVFFFFQRYFVEGVNYSGLAGQ
jgi:multiple sugar transport system permease protein